MIIKVPTEAERRAFWNLPEMGRSDPRIQDLKGAYVDGELVAVSGRMRDPAFFGSVYEDEGEWVGFLEVKEGAALCGYMILVAMRQYLKTLTEPVTIQHDDAFPKAERLLRILGFSPTHIMRPDLRNSSRMLRIWKWQPSQR